MLLAIGAGIMAFLISLAVGDLSLPQALIIGVVAIICGSIAAYLTTRPSSPGAPEEPQ